MPDGEVLNAFDRPAYWKNRTTSGPRYRAILRRACCLPSSVVACDRRGAPGEDAIVGCQERGVRGDRSGHDEAIGRVSVQAVQVKS